MRDQVWKIFLSYLFVLFLLFASSDAYSQITAIHFNAGWNDANGVTWFSKLKECEKKKLSIDKAGIQKKYNIAVIPTIIIFKDGEEVKRFQADLSFKMVATKEEIQEFIDDLIMSEF
tara:strand:- start:1252 stop:1602 length:351 start_codon:yes stop_codon:yes gene_type:complete